MGQFEILDVLKKKPNKWFSSDNFSKILNTSKPSITVSVKKLLKNKDFYNLDFKTCGKHKRFMIRLK